MSQLPIPHVWSHRGVTSRYKEIRGTVKYLLSAFQSEPTQVDESNDHMVTLLSEKWHGKGRKWEELFAAVRYSHGAESESGK